MTREGVGYVKTQLSRILFIMLTTTCFGHCGLSSGHKKMYVGNSKINLRLVGKKKRFVIAPKRMPRSNKLGLLSLKSYPYSFSLRSVGVFPSRGWKSLNIWEQL